MRKFFFTLFTLMTIAAFPAYASEHELIFPQGEQWPRLDPAEAGWRQDRLEAAFDYARAQHSSSLMLLMDGKIVAERNWRADGGLLYRQLAGWKLPDGRVREDVASMQKSIVAVLAVMARERGKLDFDAAANRYLKPGWSQATPEQETAITVRHIMSMTSGLDTGFHFKAAPGSVWAYNTAVYSTMIAILEAAAGEGIAPLTQRWLTGPLGMSESSWEKRPWVMAGADANAIGFVTSARDMARLGLMLLADGRWRDQTILQRAENIEELTAPSQAINPAYGLLWWSNRETTLTSAGVKAKGLLFPNAPPQAWFALGALTRVLCIVPERNVIVVRLGAETEPAFTDTLWGFLRDALPTLRSPQPAQTP